MSKRCVWVVEIQVKAANHWRVCYPVRGHVRGLRTLAAYRRNNPKREFRVTKYVPEKP